MTNTQQEYPHIKGPINHPMLNPYFYLSQPPETPSPNPRYDHNIRPAPHLTPNHQPNFQSPPDPCFTHPADVYQQTYTPDISQEHLQHDKINWYPGWILAWWEYRDSGPGTAWRFSVHGWMLGVVYRNEAQAEC
ncbi:hypothetical protein PCASD_09696 [Puccinia coronata f. sp. avenae]|uniref:Uncharacterized protein n=1 Tax=Puccinia coronata f. sp. avenae TaxID=200324 RepID=A0A2N5TFE2_9BASI|nr:hypothetical protein PCASD_09696 [Puccinia coronata f. sp. avenae]